MTQTKAQVQRSWKKVALHPSEKYHLFNEEPAYSKRFDKVLKFHAPGLAPVYDDSGAYHIDVFGNPIYEERYSAVFGFYNCRAAVQLNHEYFHILDTGEKLYLDSYAWVGNFQEGICVVRDFDHSFFHIHKNGQRVYKESYFYAGDFKDGYAVVQNKEGLSTHIDASGHYLHAQWFLDLDIFHKGYARACDEQGWFHIDKLGRAIYKQRFKNIEPFYNSISRCENFDRSIVLMNENGEIIHTTRPQLQDPFHQAAALLVPYWKTETLKCAISLNLFELLPNSTDQLAQQMNLLKPNAELLLHGLCEMELLFLDENNQYQLTDSGAYFQKKNPDSLHFAQQLFLEDPDHHLAWSHLKECLMHNQDYYSLHKQGSYFSTLQHSPNKRKLYHRALAVYAQRDYKIFAPFFIQKEHRFVLDVGGSYGSLLNQILSQDANVQGMLLDLPGVASKAQFDAAISNRVEIIEQDFFKPWQVHKTDAIIMSRILHDWSDQEALEILSEAKKNLQVDPKSSLYILEFILDKKSFKGSLLNLNMKVMTTGQERTLDEYSYLLQEAGFYISQICSLNEVTSVIVAKPKEAF